MARRDEPARKGHYAAKKSVKLTKVCTSCKQELPRNNGHFYQIGKYWSAMCKPCQAVYKKKAYKAKDQKPTRRNSDNGFWFSKDIRDWMPIVRVRVKTINTQPGSKGRCRQL